MDINLKNIKSINLRILILTLCFITLPFLIIPLIRGLTGFTRIEVSNFLVLIVIILSLVNSIKGKTLVFKETTITKLYSNIFLEIRALLAILLIYSLSDFYTVSYYDSTVLIFLLTFILMYLVQIDIYKLYLLNETNTFEIYIYEKSIMYKLYKLIKKVFLTKSITSKIRILILIFIIYVIFIFIVGYSTAYGFGFHFFDFPEHISKFFEGNALIKFIAILATIAMLLCFIYICNDITRLQIRTHNIASGNYDKNEVKESIFFKDISKNITEIEYGLTKAIDKAIKSEKMKGELITNVSHDLKTPLTSIINYVDLLDNDNLSDEKKKAYLEILKERSLRLKVLIEDLFEASKSASGNLEMHMEDLDPVALLRQTLGEFEDKTSTSNLDFIRNIPEQKLSIYADGKKTFRVFQNLISNILKYSLKGTRVYIDVEEKDDFVSITFKNISEYSLNFTEEEILERFKRGDASRTTEGSGLGLSIAKNLVELQGGIFEIKLDGDLFKVVVLLKKQKL